MAFQVSCTNRGLVWASRSAGSVWQFRGGKRVIFPCWLGGCPCGRGPVLLRLPALSGCGGPAVTLGYIRERGAKLPLPILRKRREGVARTRPGPTVEPDQPRKKTSRPSCCGIPEGVLHCTDCYHCLLGKLPHMVEATAGPCHPTPCSLHLKVSSMCSISLPLPHPLPMLDGS